MVSRKLRGAVRTAPGASALNRRATACGWTPSPYFSYPLATIVVLTNAYW